MSSPSHAPSAVTVAHDELLVLVDDFGAAVGFAPEMSCLADERGPLHLAVSLLPVRGSEVLLTRRTPSDGLFGGDWMLGVHAHARPGDTAALIAERLLDRLGARPVGEMRPILPEFRHRSFRDDQVDNELCPVFVVEVDDVSPSAEVCSDHEWVAWSSLREDVLRARRRLVGWSTRQVAALIGAADDPLAWPAADARGLPRALH